MQCLTDTITFETLEIRTKGLMTVHSKPIYKTRNKEILFSSQKDFIILNVLQEDQISLLFYKQKYQLFQCFRLPGNATHLTTGLPGVSVRLPGNNTFDDWPTWGQRQATRKRNTFDDWPTWGQRQATRKQHI